MSIESQRSNLKEIIRREIPVSVALGSVEAIIGLNETVYGISTGNDSRITNLENNETIYQVFSYVGTSASGQVPVYSESSIFDIYGDGVVDAIAVKADGNQKPIEEIVTDSGGNQITVTSLIDNLDDTANYILSGTPTENACVVYFLKIKDEFKSNIPEDNIIPPAINVKLNPLTAIIVADAGGDFTNQKDALASINPDENNRYTILDYRSIGTEDNPVQLKEYVTVKSVGSNNTTRIVAANPNQDLYLGAHLAYLIGLSLFGVSGVGYYAIKHTTAGEMVVKDCVFTDCVNGIHVNNVSALINIFDCGIYTPGAVTTTRGIYVQAGNVTIDFLKIVATSDVTTIIEADGSNSIMTINRLLSFSPNVVTGMKFTDGCRIAGSHNNIVACTDALVVYGNNAQVRLIGLVVFNTTNDGLRIENTGTNVELALFSTTISGCANLNVNILNPNSLVSGSGFSEINKFYLVTGARFYASILDVTEDDEGINMLGELHVGTPENPTESVFGEGDSYTRGMLAYTYDGSSFVDISVNARSASGSTFTFPNLNADTAIYVASSLMYLGNHVEHFGIKTKVNTIANFGAGNIVAEYWNGSTYVEVNTMETESSSIAGKYFPKAKNIFQTLQSNHIRYDADLINDDWSENDPMTLGDDYYWMRYRITAAITTAPIFEQWKIHSSRTEINADGWVEYFGRARPIGQLPIIIGLTKPFAGNMQNQSIWVSDNIAVGFVTNKFTTTTDILGISTKLPLNTDTSSHIHLLLSGLFSNSHTPVFTIRWAWIKQGDTLYTSNPSAIPNSDSLTISRAVVADINEVVHAHMDISSVISRRESAIDDGDELWISIQITTLTGTFSLSNGTAEYVKWCDGGHI